MSTRSLRRCQRLARFARPLAACIATLALARGASPAIAEISPEARAVVERYVEATGGAAAARAESTLYTHAKLEGFGFVGTVEVWLAKPNRRVSRTALGPFKLAEWSAGDASWRTDPTTGKVVKVTDRDLDRAQQALWYELERWAEPDQGGGRIALARRERDSTGAFAVLAMTPPNGEPREMWFDDASGLLVRESEKRDAQTVVSSLSDYRLAAGRRRAFVSATAVTGMPANRLVATLDSLAVNASFAGVAFTPDGATGPPPVRWLKSSGVATLPFEYRARHVWLRASLNGGPPEDFLFDTGASVTVLDSGYAARVGLKTEGRMQAAGAGASGGASFTNLASLRVADDGRDGTVGTGDGIELEDLKVAVLSVNPQFAPYFWREMAGILGYDVISRFVVEIDYDRHVLRLTDPKAFHYEGREAPIPMVLNGVIPAVHATLDDGIDGLFRLDVGSSSTVDLHGPFVRRHGLEGRMSRWIEVTGAGFGGTFSSKLGRLSKLAIGPYSWREPMVMLSGTKEGAFASEDFAGNMGNRILERFKVTLDYDGRRIWLEPGAKYRVRDQFSRSGLLLVKRNARIEALSVLPGSPAAKAGLKDGDIVEALDERPMTDWNPSELEDLFERGKSGRVVRLAVRRGADTTSFKMKLKEMLP